MIADRIVPNDVPADVAFVECDITKHVFCDVSNDVAFVECDVTKHVFCDVSNDVAFVECDVTNRVCCDVSNDVAFVECDVRDSKSFRNAFIATKEKFGGVDVVVNNAGVLKEARYEGVVNFPLPLAPSHNLRHQQN